MARVLKLFAAALLLSVAGHTALADEKPRVVAVNYPLQYFAERLLGGAAEVVFPVPEDVDPSFWRPSISDISTVQSAELILLNGAGFATWIDRVSLPRARVVNTSRAIEDQFIVTESITHSHGDGGEHSHEGVASYTWLAPMLASAQAEAVAAAIARKGLAPPDEVYAKLGALIGELETLAADAKLALSGAREIPMVATHPRYQYLAQRYDLSIASLEWEAGEAPSAEGLAELEALVTETGARILIWEAEPPAVAIEATDALGIQSVVFDPMAHAPIDGTYPEAFAAAVTNLADAAGLRPAN